MQYLTASGWGGVAQVTVSELLNNRVEWRERLYERKMLVLKGLHKLTAEAYWELHNIWGKPWSAADYKTSTERCIDIGGGKWLTEYGNLITKKSIGNRKMPWHRDIPWHRDKRYPVRSLYPVSMTLGAGATGTSFCDCDVLLERLNDKDAEQLRATEVQIHSWYQLQHQVETPDRQWIPLVEQHAKTGRESVLLNSFGPEQPGAEFSTPLSGTWILDARLTNDRHLMSPLTWINYLHRHAVTPDNVYTHQWEMGDLVLFDNSSGVFHARGNVVAEVNAERLFWRMNLRHNWQPTP